MKSKVLVLGFALISVCAVAESSSKADSAKKSGDTNPPAAAAVQPGAKVTPEKMEAGSESLKMVNETPGKAKPSAADDWQTKKAVTGDMNGDGKTDATASSSSEVKAPRDVATGQASGKRQHQHQPVTLKKDDAQKPANEKK